MKISAFDLDHTLFHGNSSFRFGLYLYKKGILPISKLFLILSCYVQHSLGWLSITDLHKQAFDKLFQGRSESQIKGWVEDFLRDSFESSLYHPACDKLKQAHADGHLIAILSSSPDFLVEPIAKRFKANFWQGTKYSIDKDQRFCHIAHTILSDDKAQFIAKLCQSYDCSKKDVTAYSDSYLDLSFLLAAGKAIGVNPDRRLSAFCRRHQWPII